MVWMCTIVVPVYYELSMSFKFSTCFCCYFLILWLKNTGTGRTHTLRTLWLTNTLRLISSNIGCSMETPLYVSTVLPLKSKRKDSSVLCCEMLAKTLKTTLDKTQCQRQQSNITSPEWRCRDEDDAVRNYVLCSKQKKKRRKYKCCENKCYIKINVDGKWMLECVCATWAQEKNCSISPTASVNSVFRSLLRFERQLLENCFFFY